MLFSIVNFCLILLSCGKQSLVEEFNSAMAIGSKVDGQVDAYQVQNKFIHKHHNYVTQKGQLVSVFLSAEEEPPVPGAQGMLDAIKLSCNEIGWSFEDTKQTISSITTDGENAMSGSQSGLWVRLQAECKLNLITQVVCWAQSYSIAFKAVTNTVVEIKILMTDVVSVALYFRVSGKRTQELQNVASELNPPVELLAWPQYKEVRMVEFTAQLL